MRGVNKFVTLKRRISLIGSDGYSAERRMYGPRGPGLGARASINSTICTARPMASAECFCPLGPVGISSGSHIY